MRRRVAKLVLSLTLLAGAVFALQGLRLLPSAVMYGKPEWVVIGVASVLVSATGLAILARRASP